MNHYVSDSLGYNRSLSRSRDRMNSTEASSSPAPGMELNQSQVIFDQPEFVERPRRAESEASASISGPIINPDDALLCDESALQLERDINSPKADSEPEN